MLLLKKWGRTYQGVNTQYVLMALHVTSSPKIHRTPERYEKSFLMPRQATQRHFFWGGWQYAFLTFTAMIKLI